LAISIAIPAHAPIINSISAINIIYNLPIL
jgi:hypothetical protein